MCRRGRRKQNDGERSKKIVQDENERADRVLRSAGIVALDAADLGTYFDALTKAETQMEQEAEE